LEEKEVFVPHLNNLTNLQPGSSRKTRPIRAAKAKAIGKLSEVMKIQMKKKEKFG